MKEACCCCVGLTFCLHRAMQDFPRMFSKQHMPQERKVIRLTDTDGFQWEVRWIMPKSAISGGWAAFSRDHDLEEGDMCVFEVIDSSNYTLLVHIFKVAQFKSVLGTYDPDAVKGENIRPKIKTCCACGEELTLTDIQRNLLSHSPPIKAYPEDVKVDVEATIKYDDMKPTWEQPRTVVIGTQNVEKVDIEMGAAAKVELDHSDSEAGITLLAFANEKWTWCRVFRLIRKRQNKTNLEFLVDLEDPRSTFSHALKDRSGNISTKVVVQKWVPYNRFAPDFTWCII